MANPIPSSLYVRKVPNRLETIEQIALREMSLLRAEIPDLSKSRDYYEGRQKLSFGTQKFRDKFGTAFEGFKDNWCGVIVDAVTDKLEIEALEWRQEEDVSRDIRSKFARALELSFFPTEQAELFDKVVSQGRGAVIIWPDIVKGFTIHWNPPELVRVSYTNDDPYTPAWAIKHWKNDSGEVLVNVYTADFLYKFKVGRDESGRQRFGTDSQIPQTSSQTALEPRQVANEPWPLPNPMGVVPVVELHNNGAASEIRDHIPQQDAINYLLISGMVASEFSSFPRPIIHSAAKAPEGGFDNSPGVIWRFPVMFDAEGKPLPFSAQEFKPSTLSEYRQMVDMFVQHMALTSKTPMRLFFQSDRGGRGDAPSGESLRVEDQPLLDKVEDKQKRMSSAWIRVSQIAFLALTNTKSKDGSLPPLLAEPRWKDRQADYRTALLDDALKMKELGLPMSIIVKKLGLSKDEVNEIEKMIAAGEIENVAPVVEEGDGFGEGGDDGGDDSSPNSSTPSE